MPLLQKINHFLRASPTHQVVEGEPQDVEKDTRQTPGYSRRLKPSFGNFKASVHSLKHSLFKGLPSTYQSPIHRGLPIISGILIPFSILLSIPSLTDRWYIRTGANNVTLEARPNSFLLNLGMGFSMACGVLANICLIVRFSERKVLWMTRFCILFLTLHDIINIAAVTIYGVQHHESNDGLTYGQSFWFTICSTIASTITNITLLVDYFRTKDFVNSGSGLTDKQRSLLIIVIVLLCYLGFGSLIQSFMLKITFIDAIYFCVVSIETIGFGDIHPTSTGARIFTSFFIVGGILNITLAVTLIRQVLLEGVALGFEARVQAIRTHQHERRIRTRWRTAVKLRLRANNLPMWVADGGGECNERDWQYHHHHHWWRWALQGWHSLEKRLLRKSVDKHCRKRKHLNLRALTEAQMEEAALEAGAPLADLLPPGLHLAIAADDMEGDDDEEHITDRGEVPFMHSMTIQDEAILKDTIAAQEKTAFVARLTVALLVFIVFWMTGSVIFMRTENWEFGTAVYFCFIAFTTVGYGDYSPETPAGRSIFIVWALLGVATMTILISILVEAYSRQFESVIRTDIFPDTPHDDNGTRQIRFLESAGTVTTGTNDLISPKPLSSSEHQSFTLATSSSSTATHREWEPSMASIPEEVFPKHQKKCLESLHEILRRARSLCLFIASENLLEDANLIESISNTVDLRASLENTPLGTMTEVDKVCQIEKNMQEIISAAVCALEILDGGKKKESGDWGCTN